MYKNASYKEKFDVLQQWFPEIINSIKKDLKNEHLKNDIAFIKKYLAGTNLNKITNDELATAYQKAVSDEDGNNFGDFITSRWLIKNSEIYDFFEEQLKQLSQDFTALEEIAPQAAQKISQAAVKEFGPSLTYQFAVLNSVVFPAETFHQLEKQAKAETKQKQEESVQNNEKATLESLQRSYEREMARVTDKYEKKLSGLQKKYITDTEGFKKQIAQLQRKLKETV